MGILGGSIAASDARYQNPASPGNICLMAYSQAALTASLATEDTASCSFSRSAEPRVSTNAELEVIANPTKKNRANGEKKKKKKKKTGKRRKKKKKKKKKS